MPFELCRIVITDMEGRYLDQIGGNGPALRDGSFEAAALSRPQGSAYSHRRDCLYVADTENIALREVMPQHLYNPTVGWYQYLIGSSDDRLACICEEQSHESTTDLHHMINQG